MALRPIRLNAPVAGSTASTTDDDGNVRTIDIQVVKIVNDAGVVVDPSTSVITGNSSVYVDRSGTITTGGAAQVLMAANPAREGWSIQNKSTGLITVSSVATPSATVGFQLAPGQLYECPAHGINLTSISVWGATTGQAFEAREW